MDILQLEENIVNEIISLYKVRKWKEIVERYHDHPERNKLLWVYPTEDNFNFIKTCLRRLNCDNILSIGCGSGLLEWMITEATGIAVSGLEVDGAWWRCKYAPPSFIPLIFTSTKLGEDLVTLLQRSDTTALMFCYFNNRDAFKEYLKYYSGNVLILIGPGDGKGVHTDPKPFGDVDAQWKLHQSQEVRNSRDYIAVYCKTN